MDILIVIEFLIVLAMIFAGVKIGGIGMGITGMIGVFVLVYIFHLPPGKVPVDVMLIILSVISAAAAMQASGGLDYLVNLAARFLRKHPGQITYLGPLVCWMFCLLAGTAHTCYPLLPIISDIAKKNKVRPERPLSVSAIAASLGITGSPVSAATAAIISMDLLGGKGIELRDVLLICVPSSFIAIIIAAFIQNRIGKELEDDPEYQRRLKAGLVKSVNDEDVVEMDASQKKFAKRAVVSFLFGVTLVVLFGIFPSLRPLVANADGSMVPVSMSHTIEMTMLAITGLIALTGKVNIKDVTKGSIFSAGMCAMISIFGVAWMGDTYFSGHLELFKSGIADIISQEPMLFSVALFIMSIMLFSQAVTVRTLFPLGIALGINPLLLVAMFPSCNGYFFLPNYPTEVAAINFDDTGTTKAGKFLIDHSFQTAGFITTFVSIGLGYLAVVLLY